MRSVTGNVSGCNKKVVYTIYNSLVRSIVHCGYITFGSACNSLTEKLNVILAKALRICCVAFITTPISAL